MIRNKFLLFYLALCWGIFLASIANGQQLKIDSLYKALEKEKSDTLKVKTLYALSRAYSHDGDYTSGIKFAKLSGSLADSLHYLSGSARASMAIGIAYYHFGNFPEALSNDLDALKKYEMSGSSLGIGDAHNLVGNVYYDQRDYKNAFVHYELSVICFRKAQNKQRLAGAMNNVANVYNGQGNFQKAISIYDSILDLQRSVGNTSGENDCYMSLGEAFKGLGEFDIALYYFQKALMYYEKSKNSGRIAYANGATGEVFLRMKKFEESKKYFQKALELSNRIGYKEGMMEIYSGLSIIDSATGNFKSALSNYKIFITYRDSLQNEGNTKRQTQVEMQYSFDKKTAADSIRNFESQKRDELKHNQEIQQQKFYTYGGIVGFVLMLIVAVVSFRAFRNKQKANEIIALQKEMVEEKQKEILDSIHYSKRIQQSMMPTEKYIDKNILHLKNQK